MIEEAINNISSASTQILRLNAMITVLLVTAQQEQERRTNMIDPDWATLIEMMQSLAEPIAPLLEEVDLYLFKQKRGSLDWRQEATSIGFQIFAAASRHPQLQPLETSFTNFLRKAESAYPVSQIPDANNS